MSYCCDFYLQYHVSKQLNTLRWTLTQELINGSTTELLQVAEVLSSKSLELDSSTYSVPVV